MVVINNGKSGLSLAFAGSMGLPAMCDIGTGSGAIGVTRSGLITPVATAVYTSRDISTLKQCILTFDFSSITMSGLTFREFGVRTSGGGLGSGTYFNVESVNPITYDGTNELQIQETFTIF